MSQSTDFDGARTATAQSVLDLYGATEKTAVETAWCAVGVGACPSTDAPPPSSNTLENGVTESSLASNVGTDLLFTMEVPAGATNISFNMSSGTGDADLYVNFGAKSTTSSYDCHPYKTGNNETCSFTNPSAGVWYMDLNGYATASGIALNLNATP
jgi:vibriolysin